MSDAVLRDPGPMARLREVMADEGAPAEVFRLLTDAEQRMTLTVVANLWRVPKGRFIEWYTTQHAVLYDAALKVRADEMAHEALEVADTPRLGVTRKTKEDGSVEVTEEDMLGHRKLQVDARLKLAAKWDRARYGERVEHKHLHVVDFAERLRRARERVIGQGVAPGEPGQVERVAERPALAVVDDGMI